MSSASLISQAERIVGITDENRPTDSDILEASLSEGARAVFHLLRRLASPRTGAVRISVSEVARHLGWKRYRAAAALRELRQTDYVLVDRSSNANTYLLPVGVDGDPEAPPEQLRLF